MAGRINYNHLRYFWAVAHEGNLTKTADLLNVSQSALSVQIRKLEEQIGHALFERRGRQLILTEAGRLALDHADEIFARGEELLDTLADRDRAGTSVLRVGAVSTLSRNFQLQFLRPVLGRKDTEVTVRSGNLAGLITNLEALQLDVVLTSSLPMRDATTPWISHTIAEQPVGLVGTPARIQGDRPLEELLSMEPVVVPTVESSIRIGFDALMDQLALRPRFAAEVDDMAMLRLMARADIGLTVVSPIVVQDELESGQLKQVNTLPKLSETFYALTMSRRFPNPLLRELIAKT